jgi:hypothetical protein
VVAHEQLVRLLVADELEVLTPRFLEAEGWQLNNVEFPHLDVTFQGSRPLRVRLNYEDWPDRPPSAELLEASGQGLTVGANIPGVASIFNMSLHPTTGKPFICMRGFHEFHTHPSHLNERWENFKGDGNNLVGLLMQVARAWRKVYLR